MKLIIEGPDGVGKTTLVRQLADHFKCDIVVMTEKGSKEIRDYEQKAELNNVVSDRSFLSEIVYAMVAGRRLSISPQECRYLFDLYRNNGWIFLILDADVETLLSRINQRGNEDQWKINKMESLRILYRTIAHFYDLPIVNTEKLSTDQIIKCLEELQHESHNCK